MRYDDHTPFWNYTRICQLLCHSMVSSKECQENDGAGGYSISYLLKEEDKRTLTNVAADCG